ncbi:MAG: hypothetical protein OZ921_01735 [Sorangiineae bacterium]|nr:hypothetical protein [Polyangiaceae bacterium]MEB2321204.1 hypothetical protein [Sorangiineae bacterium]
MCLAVDFRTCVSGVCVCDAGKSDCGQPGCVDLTTNEKHCGACRQRLRRGVRLRGGTVPRKNVHFTDASTGTVNAVPKAGGAIAVLGAPIASDGQYLYDVNGAKLVRAQR